MYHQRVILQLLTKKPLANCDHKRKSCLPHFGDIFCASCSWLHGGGGGEGGSEVGRLDYWPVPYLEVECTLQMKDQWESNINVWFQYMYSQCSARDWDRIRITWGNPQSGCSDICSYSKRATVGVRTPMRPGETPVWSESSVDERNLYFARSAIIGLAVETWRVKTELIIITILHIIILTASILNLGFKNNCAKNIGAYNMHK